MQPESVKLDPVDYAHGVYVSFADHGPGVAARLGGVQQYDVSGDYHVAGGPEVARGQVARRDIGGYRQICR